MSNTQSSPNIVSTNLNTLIIVCGHAIFYGTNPHINSHWYVSVFQDNEQPTFIEHVRGGIRQLYRSNHTSTSNQAENKHVDTSDPNIVSPSSSSTTRASNDDDAKGYYSRLDNTEPAAESGSKGLLAFSGGPTNPLTSLSEAQSYFDVAQYLLSGNDEQAATDPEWIAILSHREKLLGSMVVESWATESFQNVLLALLQWPLWQLRQQTNTKSQGLANERDRMISISDYFKFPPRIIVIGHEFKRPRFTELHFPAIRSLYARVHLDIESRFEYIGINPPWPPGEADKVIEQERKKGFEPWKVDKWGGGEYLMGKRRERGWHVEKFLQWYQRELDASAPDMQPDDKASILEMVTRMIGLCEAS